MIEKWLIFLILGVTLIMPGFYISQVSETFGACPFCVSIDGIPISLAFMAGVLFVYGAHGAIAWMERNKKRKVE